MAPIILGKAHERIIMSEKSITFPRDAMAPRIVHDKYKTWYKGIP